MGFQAPANLNSIHPRHMDVQKNQIGRSCLDPRQALTSIACFLNDTVNGSQMDFRQRDIRRVIICHEDRIGKIAHNPGLASFRYWATVVANSVVLIGLVM